MDKKSLAASVAAAFFAVVPVQNAQAQGRVVGKLMEEILEFGAQGAVRGCARSEDCREAITGEEKKPRLRTPEDFDTAPHKKIYEAPAVLPVDPATLNEPHKNDFDKFMPN